MWIIDDHGNLRHFWSTELRHRVGARIGGEELADYLVTNLGFVEIKIIKRDTRLRLRPRYVSKTTLAGLCIWLCGHGNCRSRVDWLVDTWRHEVVVGVTSTIRLIEALCEASVVTENRVPARTRRLTQSTAFKVNWEEVRRLAPVAAENVAARSQLSLLFGGRWTVSELDTGTGQVTVRSMGEGYPLYDCAWTCQPLGKSFAEFPDPAYGQFVTESHRQAIERPIHDEVDAHINWPRFGLLQTHYERVIAPVGSGARTLLLSASKVDASINLRGVLSKKPFDVGDQLGARHP